jgi:hypothetical protein
MLSAFILSCFYPECLYAECLYAECLYAECLYAECLYTECLYAECLYAECLYACVSLLSVYAECHSIECHNPECRGALKIIAKRTKIKSQTLNGRVCGNSFNLLQKLFHPSKCKDTSLWGSYKMAKRIITKHMYYVIHNKLECLSLASLSSLVSSLWECL